MTEISYALKRLAETSEALHWDTEAYKIYEAKMEVLRSDDEKMLAGEFHKNQRIGYL